MLDLGAGSAKCGKGLLSFVRQMLRMTDGGGRTRLNCDAHAHRRGSAGGPEPNLRQAPLTSSADATRAVEEEDVLHSTAVAGATVCMSNIELEAAVDALCEAFRRLSAGSFEPMSPQMFNVQFDPVVKSFNQFGWDFQVSLGEVSETADGLARGVCTIDQTSKEIADRTSIITKALDDGQRPFQKVKILGGAIECEAQTVKLIAFGTSVASKVSKVHADHAERGVVSIEQYAERINALVEFVQSARASVVDEANSTGKSPSDRRERSANPPAAGPAQICAAMTDIHELSARIATEAARCRNAMKQLSASHLEMAHSAEALRHKSQAIVSQAHHLDQAVGELGSHMRQAHYESQRLQSASCRISTQSDNLALTSLARRNTLCSLGGKEPSDFAARREVSSFVTPSAPNNERVVAFPKRGRRGEGKTR